MQAISDKTVLIEILTKVINKTNDHFDDIYLKEFVTDLKRENDFINNQITEKVSEIIENICYEVISITKGLSNSSSQYFNNYETAKKNYEFAKKYYQDNKIEAILLLKKNTSYGPYKEADSDEYLESISII